MSKTATSMIAWAMAETQTHSALLGALAALWGLVACSGEASPTQETTSHAAMTSPVVDDRRSTEIESAQVHGVWVFYNQPDLAADANISGLASVEDGCLRVDGAVMVWWKRDAATVAAFVDSLTGHPPRLVQLGGGSRGADEGARFAEQFAELLAVCPTSAVSFSGPLPEGWLGE